MQQATKTFKIGGMKDVEPVGEKSEDRLDSAIKSFLELGREKAKKPKKAQKAKHKKSRNASTQKKTAKNRHTKKSRTKQDTHTHTIIINKIKKSHNTPTTQHIQTNQ